MIALHVPSGPRTLAATIVITPTGKTWRVDVRTADGGYAARVCRTQRNAERTARAIRDHLVRQGSS